MIRNLTVWPTLFLLNSFNALKGLNFNILFVATAADVVLCGCPKKEPLASSIVQFIFSFGPLKLAEIL